MLSSSGMLAQEGGMMAQEYVYSAEIYPHELPQTITPQSIMYGAVGARLKEDARDLGQKLSSPPMDGWEAVSHHVLIYDNALVISFLIRRPK